MIGYTKLFSTIVTSTVWQEDSDTKVVWVTMLALADAEGRVDATIPGLANVARVSVPNTRRAIQRFLSPDPDSRTKDFSGRRIEEMPGGWRLLNHAKYRQKMNADERREYLRQKQAERRAKHKSCQHGVNKRQQMSTVSTHTESESDADSTLSNERVGTTKGFAPPTLDNVREYAHQRKSKLDPDKFFDRNEAAGWMVGKYKMKDWRAAFRYWERTERPRGNSRPSDIKRDFSQQESADGTTVDTGPIG